VRDLRAKVAQWEAIKQTTLVEYKNMPLTQATACALIAAKLHSIVAIQFKYNADINSLL